jgi:hypothetical protein
MPGSPSLAWRNERTRVRGFRFRVRLPGSPFRIIDAGQCIDAHCWPSLTR